MSEWLPYIAVGLVIAALLMVALRCRHRHMRRERRKDGLYFVCDGCGHARRVLTPSREGIYRTDRLAAQIQIQKRTPQSSAEIVPLESRRKVQS